MLDRKVFTDSAVAETMNAKFVAMKVNAEKGEGIGLKDRFKVNGFPTAVIVDPEKKEELDRLVGYSPPEEYLKGLKEILAGNHFAALKAKVRENPDDLEIWSRYAGKLEERDPAEAREAWKKIASLDPRDEKGKGGHAAFMIARAEALKARSPSPLLEIARKFDGKPAALEAHRFIARLLGRSLKEEDRKVTLASYEYIVTHGGRDAQTLNSYAWDLATHAESLEKALAMAEEAVRLEPKSAPFIDTLAECLWRLGRKEEALAAAKRALEAAEPAAKKQFEERLKDFQGPRKKRL